jgi:hypothetical protein
MARQSGAVERLRGAPSPDVLLRMLMLHVARGSRESPTILTLPMSALDLQSDQPSRLAIFISISSGYRDCEW